MKNLRLTSTSLNELPKSYPYNKIELFNDEMTVQAEKDDLEIKAKQMTEALKSAKIDFKNVFSFDFTLAD